MAWLQQQQQLILRLPEPLAKVSRRILYKDKGKNSTSVSVRPQGEPMPRLVQQMLLSLSGLCSSIHCLLANIDAASPSNDFIFTLNGQDYPALVSLGFLSWCLVLH
jgi:hypothetical protein